MSKQKLQIDWINSATLILIHLLAVAAIVYLAMVECSLWTLGLGLLWFASSGMSITGGYHRLFAHRSYRTRGIVRAFYLLFGAAAVQNSALRWCADHRRHHSHTDRDDDPYDARRGFFWSHIGWVMFQPDHPRDMGLVHDLRADPLVRFQNRYYVPLAILMVAVVPACIGLSWGDPIGALLVAGFLRLVAQWHATFSVNSFAHILGSQPFTTRNSSRDSFLTAILTLGEGYHNYHHAFQHDYRNGICWHHYDPTKWTLWTLDMVGLASNLRRVPNATIEARRQGVVRERRRQGTMQIREAEAGPASSKGSSPESEDVVLQRADYKKANVEPAPLP